MDAAGTPRRRLLVVLFVAGVVLLLDQVTDLAATLLSQRVELSAASWRFGLFGLAASRTSALLVGDVMLFVAALGLGWRRPIRVLGVLHLVLALAVAVGLVLFLLDAVQLRGAVPPGSSRAFMVAALRAAGIGFVAAVALAWAGAAAWRFGARERKGRGESTPILLARKEKTGG